VVPATMRLMGKWNWWSPKWLDNLFPAAKPQNNSNGQESE